MRNIDTVVIGMPVTDMTRSKAWITKVLDVPDPSREMPGIAEYDLGGFWLQLVTSPHAGRAGISVSFSVQDVQTVRREFINNDLPVTDIQRMGDVVDYFEVYDPDGNSFRFVTLLA